MTVEILLLIALLVTVAACVTLSLRLVRRREDPAQASGGPRPAAGAERHALRQLRLASHNLRAIGMALQGHAENLEAGNPPDIADIASAATGVFDIADYMHEWAEHADATHVLNEETLPLGSALDEAISTVTLAIRPGRRTWHVDPDVLRTRVLADRRALRHVLTRALSASIRSSGRAGTIDIRLESAELEGGRKAMALIIEEQPGPDGRGNAAAGGPDLRLTLARTLMEAHGGQLDAVQGDDLVVRVTFPIERFSRSAGEVRENPRINAARNRNDDRTPVASVT